jgi:hypothetical protein
VTITHDPMPARSERLAGLRPGAVQRADRLDPAVHATEVTEFRRSTAGPALAGSEVLRLQRLAGNRVVAFALSRDPDRRVQRFGSEEHRVLGDAATGTATIDLDIGDQTAPLTQGDLVALSGDYFGSPAEILALAGTGDGKAQIRWRASRRCTAATLESSATPPRRP